ncbi:MAG: TolC family protein [Pirellulaceae bacterium]
MKRYWWTIGFAAFAVSQTACRLDVGTQIGKHEFRQSIAFGGDSPTAMPSHGHGHNNWMMGEQLAVSPPSDEFADPIMSGGLTSEERSAGRGPLAGLGQVIDINFVDPEETVASTEPRMSRTRRAMASETADDPLRSTYSVGEVAWTGRVGSAFSDYLPKLSERDNLGPRQVAQARDRRPANRSELRVASRAAIDRGEAPLGTELPYVPAGYQWAGAGQQGWSQPEVNVADPRPGESSRRGVEADANGPVAPATHHTAAAQVGPAGNAWDRVAPTGYAETASRSAAPRDQRHETHLAADSGVRIEPIPPVLGTAPGVGPTVPHQTAAPQSNVQLTSNRRGSTGNESNAAYETVTRDVPRVPSPQANETQAIEASMLLSGDNLGWAPALEPTHSLEQLLGMAKSVHPQISEASAQVEAAQGLWVQAGLGPNPLVGFSGQQLGSNGQAEQVGLLIEQRLLRGGKLTLDQMVAAREVGQARQRLTQAVLAVEGKVRRAYSKAVIAQRRMYLVEELAGKADENLRLTTLLVESREASQVELLRARSQAAAIRAEYEAASRQWEGALASLEAVVGSSLGDPSEPIALDDTFPTGELEPLAETLATRLDGHPALLEAQLKVDQTRWRIQRECAELYSDIDVQLVFQYDESVDAPNGILQITGPLQIRNRNQGNIRAARAEMIGASRALDRKRLEIEQAFAMRVADYEEARARVRRFTEVDGILETSRRTSDLLRQGVQAGEQDLLALFLAERDRLNAELEYLNALEKGLDVQADLETLMISSGSLP